MTNCEHFDVLVFIGRFQPPHLGHVKIFEAGLKSANKLYVLVGSTEQPRNLRNPFSFQERHGLIRGIVSAPMRTEILALPDIAYNDQAWIGSVQEIVENQLILDGLNPATARVGLIGHDKDASSYYLALFPQWQSMGVAPYGDLGATDVRDAFLRTGKIDTTNLPSFTIDFLEKFKDSQAYIKLNEERAFIDAYRKGWEASPYPPTFLTVDAVVIQSGHVLLVKRRAFPGKGLSALPGGFMNADEPLLDAMLRELREETRLKVPEPVLRGSIKGSRVFDDPHRSARGRTITHAYLIQLTPQAAGLPIVKGADDAEKALWLPLANLDPIRMYEDHYHIIQAMLSLAD